MDLVKTKSELIKHSAAVHINNTLSLMERKISNVLLNQAQPFMERKDEHTIPIKEICKALNIPDNKNYEMIKSALRALNKTQVEWNILNKDKKNKWGVTSILASVEIEAGMCTYSYSAAMKKVFSNPNIYARLNMAIQASFNSKYSIALWEYIMEFLSSNTSNKSSDVIINQLSVEDIRKLLGVDNSKYYQEFSNFNREILKKSVNEINQISDLDVSLEYLRRGKKVEYVVMYVKRPQSKLSDKSFLNVGVMGIDTTDHQNGNINYELIRDLIEDYSFPEVIAEQIVTEYPEERIRDILEYVKNQNPSNPAAYIRKALKERWEVSSKMEHNKHKSIVSDDVNTNHINSFLDPVYRHILSAFRERFGDTIFRSWFIDFATITLDSDGKLIIEIKNYTDFKRNWLKNNYGHYIIEVCSKHYPGIISVEVLPYK
jgi:plasmid replication initiation protein